MTILAETDCTKLVCDGQKHWAEDKRTGMVARVPVQKCDCQKPAQDLVK
jgi:hypothetical protein